MKWRKTNSKEPKNIFMLSLYTNYVIVDVRILVFMMKFMIYADYQVIKWARFALTNHLITCLCRLSRFTLRSSFFLSFDGT